MAPEEALARAAEETESSLVGWRVERLRTALDGPLAVVAAGVPRAAALLWARLHEAWGRPAWATTPYEIAQRGLPQGARALVLSIAVAITMCSQRPGRWGWGSRPSR